MISSVLLHFGSAQHHEPTVRLGVGLARQAAARVRGLTLVDTRRLAALAISCESAAYSLGETDRLERMEADHDQVRLRLSQACLSSGIDFEVRRVRGNPFELLPNEAQFHDLVLTCLPPLHSAPDDFSFKPAELVDLLLQGVQPLLVVRGAEQPLERILLVSDGSVAAASSLRQFVQQNLFPRAVLRLLAIDPDKERARNSWREMVEYCRGRRLSFESGWIHGNVRRVLIPYALKWGAHLVVMGVQRESQLVRRLLSPMAVRILQTTNLALYATT